MKMIMANEGRLGEGCLLIDIVSRLPAHTFHVSRSSLLMKLLFVGDIKLIMCPVFSAF